MPEFDDHQLGASIREVPAELAAAHQRRTTARNRIARSLGRAADRRRVVPSAIIGTLVMVGVGIADASVVHTLPATPPTTLPPTTLPFALYSATQELSGVSQALRQDQSLMSSLAAASQSAAAAVPGATAGGATAGTTTASPSPSGGDTSSSSGPAGGGSARSAWFHRPNTKRPTIVNTGHFSRPFPT